MRRAISALTLEAVISNVPVVLNSVARTQMSVVNRLALVLAPLWNFML